MGGVTFETLLEGFIIDFLDEKFLLEKEGVEDGSCN